jgi:hypothetical protein
MAARGKDDQNEGGGYYTMVKPEFPDIFWKAWVVAAAVMIS